MIKPDMNEYVMDKPICTVAKAKDWLGDRGMSIPVHNIKVRGRWALVKEEWSIQDNEVDCYDIASGSMYAEPWSAIKYTDSPFIPRNEEATKRAIDELDRGYEVHELAETEGE